MTLDLLGAEGGDLGASGTDRPQQWSLQSGERVIRLLLIDAVDDQTGVRDGVGRFGHQRRLAAKRGEQILERIDPASCWSLRARPERPGQTLASRPGGASALARPSPSSPTPK